MSVDVVHDINEGAIAFCSYDFFHLIVKKKSVSAGDIQKRVRDFNYGSTQKYNKPSFVNLDKQNLNQNASQLYCLMVNLPLIFLDLKDKIEPLWEPVETLLKCIQIIFSPKINENKIKSLEKYIQKHLKATFEIFERSLAPKQHFLLHYPECIRMMGPPIHLWTMRFESKRRLLTEISRRKMNFINLTKMLATKHQQRICKNPVLITKIKPSGTSVEFSKSEEFVDSN